MSKNFNVLVINPGSTSTKIGIFSGSQEILVNTIRHSTEEIAQYNSVAEQYEFRKNIILETISKNDFDIKTLDAVIGRGGLLHPIPGGTYLVNEKMKEDLREAKYGEHASNLGALLADSIAKELNIPAFIADPVVVDELEDVARISGNKNFVRKSIFHALNQKAVAKRYANEKGVSYNELTLIIAHLGGGISVGLHKNGKVIDVNNALDGEGPFSPERSGTLPAGDLVRMAFSGQYTQKEMLKMITGNGGLVSYLNTNNCKDVIEKAQNGDKEAELIFNAMVYQISKEIGALSVVVSGKVDSIILTGGIAYNKDLTEKIKKMVGWISEVTVYPGEDELTALNEAALRVLNKEEEVLNYE